MSFGVQSQGSNRHASASPSDYNIDYVDISKGLSNNYVSKVAKDHFGVMWFATEGGLGKYQSEVIQNIRPGANYPGLKNENIETLFVDSQGDIWVGTKSGGVSVYLQREDRFLNISDYLIGADNQAVLRITDITEDSNGDLWISTWGQGLFHLSRSDYHLIESFLGEGVVYDIELDAYGNLWTASNKGLFKYDPSESRMVKLKVNAGFVTALFYDSQRQQLLLGSSTGLYVFDTRNYQVTELSESIRLDFRSISAINMDPFGRIWVGSWTEGLYVSSSELDEFVKFDLLANKTNNTNYETILDIHIDEKELIWVGTAYGGVVKVSPKKSLTYISNSFDGQVNLPDNNILSVIRDARGGLWCGTWGGGIGYSLDKASFTQFELAAANKVFTFFEIGDTMLVGTSKGLMFYEVNKPENGPQSRILGFDKIRTIHLDAKKRLWIGTQQRGLFLFDYLKDPNFKHGIAFNVKEQSISGRGLNSNRISQILEKPNKELLIGTYNGLYSFNDHDSTFVRLDADPGLDFPSVIVTSLHRSRKDQLWIGMPGGLIRTDFENGKLTIDKIFNTENGLKNDYVTAITEDNEHNIWISHAAGITKIQDSTDAVINLAIEQADAFSMNINSHFNDGTNIYFGSSNGLFYFNPHMLELTYHAPSLVFNSLKIDNREVGVGQRFHDRVVLEQSMPYTDKIDITYKESIVSVGFIPVDAQNGKDLNYYYRILGLQDQWINNGTSTEISLIGLNPGSYVLEAKSTRDHVHFGEENSIRILVAPPPWLSTWALIVYLGFAVLIVVLINKFFVNRAKLKANLALAKLSREKQHELHEAKLRFFTNISHELRTPLTLIMSPIKEILRDLDLKGEVRERLIYVEKNADRLLGLINQLLDFRKAEQGELNLRVANGDFVKFVKEIFLSFKGYADTKEVTYEFTSKIKQVEMTFDRDKMEMVLCNLLSNAFKFTSKKGQITLTMYENAENVFMSIQDTGAGIAKEYQEKIFNRFFQIQDTETVKVVGSGIGLSLSQKIVHLHKGKIDVKSKPGRGTEFILTLPKGASHFEVNDFIEQFANSEDITGYGGNDVKELSMLTDVTSASEQEKILIVDDNEDILSYLKTIFIEKDYDVYSAENGREGVEVAFEINPDLIISDIMMPELDGIGLCSQLKNDIRTSHIPIILLTARTSTVYEIDGLDTGADDYVRKPFDAGVIASKVATTLANRQKLRDYLINKLRFEVDSSVKPENKEERFIQKLSEEVEAQLLDNEFNVKTLADDLCMSQSTLYRKIKSLTGLSIAGFVRSVRLKKAAEVLLTEDLNLSQVAYKVGFSDYKYFKKSFKEQYGCLPSEYEDRHAKNLSN